MSLRSTRSMSAYTCGSSELNLAMNACLIQSATASPDNCSRQGNNPKFQKYVVWISYEVLRLLTMTTKMTAWLYRDACQALPACESETTMMRTRKRIS